MENFRMNDKEITIITIDTNGLDRFDEILAVYAKRFKITRSEQGLDMEIVNTFKRFYVPVAQLNPDAAKYHKWTAEKLTELSQNQKNTEFNKNECKELLSFAKNTLIVTNSKDFLRKMIWLFTTHSQAKQISSAKVLGLVEDTKDIIKKQGQFGTIMPNLYDIMNYYGVNYDKNHENTNIEFKMLVCCEVVSKMLSSEISLIQKKFANKINYINAAAIDNFEFEMKKAKDVLKKHFDKKYIPCPLWEKVKHCQNHFLKLDVGLVNLNNLKIKKGYSSSLKGISKRVNALVFNVRGVYFFVRCDNGKVIGVSKRDLQLSVGYSGENPIFTDSIIEYLAGVYSYENVRFVPFSI